MLKPENNPLQKIGWEEALQVKRKLKAILLFSCARARTCISCWAYRFVISQHFQNLLFEVNSSIVYVKCSSAGLVNSNQLAAPIIFKKRQSLAFDWNLTTKSGERLKDRFHLCALVALAHLCMLRAYLKVPTSHANSPGISALFVDCLMLRKRTPCRCEPFDKWILQSHPSPSLPPNTYKTSHALQHAPFNPKTGPTSKKIQPRNTI